MADKAMDADATAAPSRYLVRSALLLRRVTVREMKAAVSRRSTIKEQ